MYDPLAHASLHLTHTGVGCSGLQPPTLNSPCGHAAQDTHAVVSLVPLPEHGVPDRYCVDDVQPVLQAAHPGSFVLPAAPHVAVVLYEPAGHASEACLHGAQTLSTVSNEP